MVLTDLIDANPGSDRDLLARHRPPAGRNLRPDGRDAHSLRLPTQALLPAPRRVEAYTREHGINAFYESVELRKGCCFARKVEPLRRALAGKKAWITGMRAQQSATRDGCRCRPSTKATGWRNSTRWPTGRKRKSGPTSSCNEVPYNALHDKFYPSIGCAPCTRAITAGEDVRAGRWWWENPETKECGLHVKAPRPATSLQSAQRREA
jgi:phosphoadenosine phosphosulfate reductase